MQRTAAAALVGLGVLALVVGGYQAAARAYPFLPVIYVLLIVVLTIIGIVIFAMITCTRARRRMHALDR